MEKDHRWQGEQFQANITETDTSITTTLTHGTDVIVFTYTLPGKIAITSPGNYHLVLQ